MTPTILPYKGVLPVIPESVFLSNATIIGDVVIGEEANLWFGVTVRGDVNSIRIGARTNVQDGTVVHCTHLKYTTEIGDDVTIGHLALLHGCVVESGSFIGMKACIMDNAVVESGAMVAAGALVTPGKRVKAGELWGGSPARLLRPLTEEERAGLTSTVPRYVGLAKQYMAESGGRPAAE